MKKASVLLSAMLCLSLFSCSTPTAHIIITPELLNTEHSAYTNKSSQFSIKDMRTTRHLVQILRQGEAADLISAQQPLTDIISNSLLNNVKQQGLMINKAASNKFQLFIDKALITVKQNLMSYQADNIINLRVKITNDQQTLTKDFTIKGNSQGPLTADPAVLARDFNQQLSTLLSRIVNNQEIQHFIL